MLRFDCLRPPRLCLWRDGEVFDADAAGTRAPDCAPAPPAAARGDRDAPGVLARNEEEGEAPAPRLVDCLTSPCGLVEPRPFLQCGLVRRGLAPPPPLADATRAVEAPAALAERVRDRWVALRFRAAPRMAPAACMTGAARGAAARQVVT